MMDSNFSRRNILHKLYKDVTFGWEGILGD